MKIKPVSIKNTVFKEPLFFWMIFKTATCSRENSLNFLGYNFCYSITVFFISQYFLNSQFELNWKINTKYMNIFQSWHFISVDKWLNIAWWRNQLKIERKKPNQPYKGRSSPGGQKLLFNVHEIINSSVFFMLKVMEISY